MCATNREGFAVTELWVAKVAVDKAAYHFDKLYDYLIPAGEIAVARVGSRVLVPFGAGNRKRQGVILGLGQLDSGVSPAKIKPLSFLPDDSIVLNEELLALVYYLKENTFCTYYDAVKTLLPSGAGYSLGVLCRANPEKQEDDTLHEEERRILQVLGGRTVPREKLCEALGILPQNAHFTKLAQGGWLLIEENVRRKIGDETATMARLTDAFAQNTGKLTPKQKAVTELLDSVGTASVKEIGYFTGTTPAVIKTLEKKGLVALFENQIPRMPAMPCGKDTRRVVLTPGQQAAYEGIKALYNKGEPAVSLLYGVTGSGKTSVFLRMIEDVVAHGQQVLVLVPEISLTPQTIGVFTARFGGRVALMHSGLSMGERLDEWRRVRAGAADIVVGTRSAVFAPFENIGMIILDEEQESTYQSEANPRYHAREVAKFRILRHRAQLVLCSATPSIESYYYAKTGRYHLFTLLERFGEAVLPHVAVVDMDEDRRQGNLLSLSHVLGEEIAENLKNQEQTILLLNRRGYNTVVKCAGCGTAVCCPNCSIGLTYHQANGRLLCHYCGYSCELTQKCAVCGGSFVKYTGAGTQKLEDELGQLFPSARVLRMDADTTMAKNAYEANFQRFADGDYDIMVGTQMVAKGLNFPRVTLVGVLAADSTLFGDNFKSEERTFSLLTQVVGRSGRGALSGRAYIQTHFPDNEVFELAAQQDYERFYERELFTRKLMIYPPFCQMCAVGFSGISEGETARTARDFLKLLTDTAKQRFSALPMRVLGPTPGAVARVAGKYRYKVIIKCKNTGEFRQMLAEVLVNAGKGCKGVSIYADMYFDGNL